MKRLERDMTEQRFYFAQTVSYSSFWGSSGECTDTSLGGCSAADFLEVAKEQKEQKEQGE